MIYLFVVIFILVTGAAYAATPNLSLPSVNPIKAIEARRDNKIKGVKNKELGGLSVPARKLVKECYALPVEARPFENIISVVRLLDEKYSDEDINNHFDSSRYRDEGYEFNWECRCHHARNCYMPEYASLHNKLKALKTAISEREAQERRAGMEGRLSEYHALERSLEDTTNAYVGVTKELEDKIL